MSTLKKFNKSKRVLPGVTSTEISELNNLLGKVVSFLEDSYIVDLIKNDRIDDPKGIVYGNYQYEGDELGSTRSGPYFSIFSRGPVEGDDYHMVFLPIPGERLCDALMKDEVRVDDDGNVYEVIENYSIGFASKVLKPKQVYDCMLKALTYTNKFISKIKKEQSDRPATLGEEYREGAVLNCSIGLSETDVEVISSVYNKEPVSCLKDYFGTKSFMYKNIVDIEPPFTSDINKERFGEILGYGGGDLTSCYDLDKFYKWISTKDTKHLLPDRGAVRKYSTYWMNPTTGVFQNSSNINDKSEQEEEAMESILAIEAAINASDRWWK